MPENGSPTPADVIKAALPGVETATPPGTPVPKGPELSALIKAVTRQPQTLEEAALQRSLLRAQVDAVLGPVGSVRLREVMPE